LTHLSMTSSFMNSSTEVFEVLSTAEELRSLVVRPDPEFHTYEEMAVQAESHLLQRIFPVHSLT
jgi:hypothetical protein